MKSPVHVTVWGDVAGRETAVLVHGTFNWGTNCFARQEELGEKFRLVVPDRRGFGGSPDLEGSRYSSDYEVDAGDVVELLRDGAHLVGHSYGGVVAMLAAARAPEKVWSLALIEPAAHRAADEHAVVAEAIRAGTVFMDQARQRPAEEYLELVFADGQPRPEPEEYLQRAAATALHERPCWLAEIPIEQLAAGAFPKLVINGAWDTERPGAGEVMRVSGRTVAAKIGAEHREIAGAAHDPHRDQPEVVNQLLDSLWRAAPGKMGG